jgi:FMN-dependent NADH-azoreductase
MNILRIDGSARFEGSVTRQLADEVIGRLRAENPGAYVTQRELSDRLSLLDEDWVNANFTDPAERTIEQRAALALSDRLVEELKAADLIVIAVPIYNFGVPAAVKAWIDLICRAGETFRYSENGPVGLLEDRPVYLVTASGGTPIGSESDFATGYLRHIFGFIGISDVRLIEAGQLMIDAEPAIGRARDQIDAAVAMAA